jgi:hypothetical protein
MKQLFLKDNGGTYRIEVGHWWPGQVRRWWPGRMVHLINLAQRMGSRYLTYAWVDGLPLWSTAFCCPKDTPLRKLGYHKAVGRLVQQALALGYIVVEKVEAVELDLVQNPGFGVPAVGSAGVFEKWGEDPQLAEDTHIYYTTVAGVRGE